VEYAADQPTAADYASANADRARAEAARSSDKLDQVIELVDRKFREIFTILGYPDRPSIADILYDRKIKEQEDKFKSKQESLGQLFAAMYGEL
jgi:hypothetical protein